MKTEGTTAPPPLSICLSSFPVQTPRKAPLSQQEESAEIALQHIQNTIEIQEAWEGVFKQKLKPRWKPQR